MNRSILHNLITVILLSHFTLLCSCGGSELRTFSTEKISIDIPKTMQIDNQSDWGIMFKGDDKIINLMWIDVTEGNAWDIKKFAGTFISSDHEQTCIINNDSIIGYEIRRGAITIPSGIVSTHRRGNLSFLLLTMGYDLYTHETIGKSIKNLKPITETPDNTSPLGLAEPEPTADTTSNTSIKYDSQETELLNYDGEYLSLKYPSNWVVDEHCSDLTADVYIGNSTKQIGLWIFKFDMPEDMNWNDAMESIASSWREYASVDVGNVMFKGNGWCKHDILLEIPDLTQRQISFYCHRGGYIYNIKFGNDVSSVRNNENLISEIMSSVQIK